MKISTKPLYQFSFTLHIRSNVTKYLHSKSNSDAPNESKGKVTVLRLMLLAPLNGLVLPHKLWSVGEVGVFVVDVGVGVVPEVEESERDRQQIYLHEHSKIEARGAQMLAKIPTQ